MSKNGDESSDNDTTMDDDSADDFFSGYGYLDEDFDYRLFINPIMYHVPPELRPYMQRLSADIAHLYARQEVIVRRVQHHPTFQEQTETCMDYRCNKLTSIKCSTCLAFVCLDCFENFHDTDD